MHGMLHLDMFELDIRFYRMQRCVIRYYSCETEAPAADGNETTLLGRDCPSGKLLQCTPFNKRGLLDYRAIEDMEKNIRTNHVPWCDSTAAAQDPECSQPWQSSTTCPRVPFGWKGTSLCSTWTSQQINEAAEQFYQRRAGKVRALNGTDCLQFQPVAGGISELTATGGSLLQGSDGRATIKVSLVVHYSSSVRSALGMRY
jgi:hypothetical protein